MIGRLHQDTAKVDFIQPVVYIVRFRVLSPMSPSTTVQSGEGSEYSRIIPVFLRNKALSLFAIEVTQAVVGEGKGSFDFVFLNCRLLRLIRIERLGPPMKAPTAAKIIGSLSTKG